jgi:hypothetical protein
MKYQAVARDLAGEVADQPISIKIALQGNALIKTFIIQKYMMSPLIINLVCSHLLKWSCYTGDFNKIPWSSEDIWMEMGLKNAGESGFATK